MEKVDVAEDDDEQENEDEQVPSSFTFKPIGYMKSPLCKNGSPRQGALVGNVRGKICLSSFTGNNEEHAVEDLKHFSHVWIIFVFHKNRGER